MGLSGATNTRVRFTAWGTLDTTWETPAQDAGLRRLLRLLNGGVLEYRGGTRTTLQVRDEREFTVVGVRNLGHFPESIRTTVEG